MKIMNNPVWEQNYNKGRFNVSQLARASFTEKV